MFDVVVVGAGTAGLSSALVLGRARRRTLVLDSGRPRNAPSPAAHGVFTRDGTPPAELLSIGRGQLAPYHSVELREGVVTGARAADGGFEVRLADGDSIPTRKLLLAHGVTDLLPPIEGVEELWGTGVLHCPFCHGWEVRDEPLALHGRGSAAVDFAGLLRNWSPDLVLCTDGPGELTEDDRARLDRMGVGLREEPIARLVGSDGELRRIVFADGAELPRRALFVRPAQRLSSDLSELLGCEHTELGHIRVDQFGETSVPGVFAVGDAATPMQQVIRAAAMGSAAASRITHLLVAEDFG